MGEASTARLVNQSEPADRLVLALADDGVVCIERIERAVIAREAA
jgi:hypothetical protein